ncbi:MAG: DNA polymerase III subunit beta, partial [Candidatus Nanopelagicus sp.]
MKFMVERDPLVDAVNWVSKSISNKPISTALLGIIIDATNEITLSGSDLESSANAKLKADIS